MKKKTNKFYLRYFIVFLLILIISCSSGDNTNSEPVPEIDISEVTLNEPPNYKLFGIHINTFFKIMLIKKILN